MQLGVVASSYLTKVFQMVILGITLTFPDGCAIFAQSIPRVRGRQSSIKVRLGGKSMLQAVRSLVRTIGISPHVEPVLGTEDDVS
jgi:hypothetical protein